MKRILAHGVFDLLHSGHIDHLHQAKEFGDYLTVSVLADKFVTKSFIVHDERTRAYMLSALRCVDEVVICRAPGPAELLRKLKPYIYVRSDEYLDMDKPEYEVAKKLGIKFGFTKMVPPHTSEIIDRIYNLKKRIVGIYESRR